MKSNVGQHLDVIDGFRGMLALWVFGCHLMWHCHTYMILFAEAGSAVDLFMFVSGFLMAWHWMDREASFSRMRDQAADFFIRRFFRIAPVYYFAFAIALLMRPTAESLSWQSLLLHFTFLFGIFPQYEGNTQTLPDWSISLEVQFYLLFPLLMLALKRVGPVVLVFVAMEMMQIIHGMFGVYFKPGPMGSFGDPSFIPFKLHIFVAGMLLARLLVSQLQGEKDDRPKLLFFYVLMIVYSFLYSPTAVSRWAMFLTMILVVDARYLGFILKVFSCRVARFMGDVSYSVYLLHLVLMNATLPFLMQHVLPGKSHRLDFAIAFFILIGPLYGLAYLIHIWIEVPGINLGKKFAKSWRQSHGVPAVVPES